MDDQALVRSMLAGHEAAFDAFFAAYYPRLRRFVAARIDDADAAEEVVQATLVTAVRKLRTWRGEAALFTWLCTLGRHEVSAHFARAGRQPDMHPIDDDPAVRAQLEALAAGRSDRPDQLLERDDLSRLVQLTLDWLPERYGDLLEWKYLHGLPVNEIARRTRTTPKAVESMLTRARQAFREGFATLTRRRPHTASE